VRPVLVYTASRIGLFLVTLGVLSLVGPLLGLTHPLLLILVSFLISGIASYVLLSRQRDAMSERISDKIDRPKPQDD
jgi:cytochrome c biogenesis factor